MKKFIWVLRIVAFLIITSLVSEHLINKGDSGALSLLGVATIAASLYFLILKPIT